VVSFLQKRAGRIEGPSEELRRTARTAIWGRVENARGASVEGHLEVAEVYEFTVLAALAVTERVLRGDVAPGASTPATALGADFVTTLPGSSSFRIQR
jgi:short subunit dehydrogenase-like uncharacterized protein